MVRILALADMESISKFRYLDDKKKMKIGLFVAARYHSLRFLNGLIYHPRGKDDSHRNWRLSVVLTTIRC